MKKLLLAAFVLSFAFIGCKGDDDDVTPTDVRDNIVGEYNCQWRLFNRKTLIEENKGSFELKVYKNSDNNAMFDFRINGLQRFMSGENLVTVQDGFSFQIPEQDVENFGLIKGTPIINVPGQTTRVAGHLVTATGQVVVFCERAQGQGKDDDLFEFKMTPRP